MSGARSCSGQSSWRKAGVIAVQYLSGKGRYMWRDLERTCGAMGVPLKRPEPFHSQACSPREWRSRLKATSAPFSRRVFVAEFGQGLPIGDRATLGALLTACGADPATALERGESEANKARLKAECARAAEIGMIGAPCLVTADGEVFWGNDRLEHGLDWAVAGGLDACLGARISLAGRWRNMVRRHKLIVLFARTSENFGERDEGAAQ